jgi:hypothetical protein
MTLDAAQEAFEAEATNATAAEYLRQLRQYEADDMIGDDTFLNGLEEIQQFLDNSAEDDRVTLLAQ